MTKNWVRSLITTGLLALAPLSAGCAGDSRPPCADVKVEDASEETYEVFSTDVPLVEVTMTFNEEFGRPNTITTILPDGSFTEGMPPTTENPITLVMPQGVKVVLEGYQAPSEACNPVINT